MTRALPGRNPVTEADQATRGSGIRLGAEIASRALSVATTFLLAAALGVERFGTFSSAAGIAILLAELAEVGLQATASRALVARTLALRSLLSAKLVVSLVTGAGALLAPPLLAWRWPALAGPLLAMQTPLVLYYVLSGWSELMGIALRSRGRRGQEALVLLTLRGATLAAVAWALHGGASWSGLAWAHAISAIPPLALALALAARTGPDTAPRLEVAAVLRESWPLAVNSWLLLASLRVELLVLYFVRGPYAAGLFGAAVKVVESLNSVPTAVTAGAMPSLTREALHTVATGGESRSAEVRRRLTGTVALLAVPAAMGLALEAPRVLALLGAGYAEAAPALRLLAPAVAALFMNVVVTYSLIAIGGARRLPFFVALRVLSAALLAGVLVPVLGPAGAAMGLTASEIALMLLLARACAGAGFPVPLLTPLLRALALSIPMAAVVSLSGLELLPSVAAGAIAYLATLLAAWRWAPRILSFLAAADR
jgi:O-antigen/teichoic acid export membrane protein